MGKINNYLLHFPSFIFTENTGDDISETLNLNIFWWSMHPELLDLERLPSLNFSSCAYVYIFKISHNALYYRYLIANEIIAKARKKKKINRIVLKFGQEWVGEGVHFKYCYCKLPREYNFHIKLLWRSEVLISTLF